MSDKQKSGAEMTAKEKVLKVWPDAAVWAGPSYFAKYRITSMKNDELAGFFHSPLGFGATEEVAWQNAAKSLPLGDAARIEAKIRSKIVMDDAAPEDWIWETLAVLESENRLVQSSQTFEECFTAFRPQFDTYASGRDAHEATGRAMWNAAKGLK